VDMSLVSQIIPRESKVYEYVISSHNIKREMKDK